MPDPVTPPADPQIEDDGGLDPLFKSVFATENEEPVITPAPEPEPPAEPPSDPAPADPAPSAADPTPAPDPAPAPAPATPTPAVKVAPKRRDTAEELRAIREKLDRLATPPPPLPPAAPVAPPASHDLSSLSDDQREQFELVSWAAARKPEWKGKDTALLEGWKKVEAYVAKRAADGDPAEDGDEQLARFIDANVPKIRPSHLRALDRERISADLEERLTAKHRAELDEAKRIAQIARIEPLVEREVGGLKAQIEDELKPSDELEKEVFEDAARQITGYADEYLRMAHGIADTTPNFQLILNFLDGAAKKLPVGADGKRIVPFSEWVALSPAEKQVARVMNKDEALAAFKSQAVAHAKSRVKKELEAAERRGFVRKSASTAGAQAPKPGQITPPKRVEAVEPPRVVRTASDGAGPAKVVIGDPEGDDLVATLAMK